MANYIPYHGKKRYRLAVCEAEFVGLLRQGTNAQRLQDGAEKIRSAHVRALKAVRAKVPPAEMHAGTLENLDREIRSWLGLSIGEIIEGYGTGKMTPIPLTTVRRSRR